MKPLIHITDRAKKKKAKCAICKSSVNVLYVKIAMCNLCDKCQKELSDSFDEVNRNRRFE